MSDPALLSLLDELLRDRGPAAERLLALLDYAPGLRALLAELERLSRSRDGTDVTLPEAVALTQLAADREDLQRLIVALLHRGTSPCVSHSAKARALGRLDRGVRPRRSTASLLDVLGLAGPDMPAALRARAEAELRAAYDAAFDLPPATGGGAVGGAGGGTRS